jgi:hypothetical protein
LYRFLAITVLLDVKDIPQVGPLQWGRINKLCFGKEASLTFHMIKDKATGKPAVGTMKWMLDEVPEVIRTWIENKGGIEKMTIMDAWTMTAPELWAMGYRKCEPEAPPMTPTPSVPYMSK